MTGGCSKLRPPDCPSKQAEGTFLEAGYLSAPLHCLPLPPSPWKQNKMFLINSRALACLPLYGATDQTPQYAAAAKSLQSCLTLCDPIKRKAYQAPPSLGFSRQEHWSGLPFPSPMHESEK